MLSTTKIPLRAQRDPLVLAMGDQVLTVGGFEIDGDSVLAFDDAAVYNTADDTWNAVDRAPFSGAPHHVAGVWTGSSAILVGRPCAKTSAEIEEAACPKAALEAVRYSPATRSWRRLPNVIEEGDDGSAPFVATGVGAAGGNAVFKVGSGSHSGDVLLIKPDGSSSWSAGLKGADATCAIGGKVVAIQTGKVDATGNFIAPNPVANVEALTVSTLDTERQEWTQTSSVPKPDPTADEVQQVLCGGGAIAYLGLRGHTATSVLWLDAGTLAWSQLSPIDFGRYPAALAIGATASTRVVWDSDAGHIMSSGQTSNGWTVTTTSPIGGAKLSQLDGILLVDPSYSVRPPDRQYLAFLKPAKL
ncbi:MAG: hypothetical protein ABIP21_11395 [Acidimicrobiia bacterium]